MRVNKSDLSERENTGHSVYMSFSRGKIRYFDYNPFSGELELNKDVVLSDLEEIAKTIENNLPEGSDISISFVELEDSCEFKGVKEIIYLSGEDKNLSLKSSVR